MSELDSIYQQYDAALHEEKSENRRRAKVCGSVRVGRVLMEFVRLQKKLCKFTQSSDSTFGIECRSYAYGMHLSFE